MRRGDDPSDSACGRRPRNATRSPRPRRARPLGRRPLHAVAERRAAGRRSRRAPFPGTGRSPFSGSTRPANTKVNSSGRLTLPGSAGGFGFGSQTVGRPTRSTAACRNRLGQMTRSMTRPAVGPPVVPDVLGHLEGRVQPAAAVPAADEQVPPRAHPVQVGRDGFNTAVPRRPGVRADEVVVVGRHHHAGPGPGLVAGQFDQHAGREQVVVVVKVNDLGLELGERPAEGGPGHPVVEIRAVA